MSRRALGDDRGEALILALLVLLMAAAAAALLAGDLQLRLREAQQEARAVRLSQLTDAAVAEALAELHRSATFTGSARHPLDAGWIASRVQRVPGSPDRVSVIGWAQTGETTRAVEVEVRLINGFPRVQSWRRSTEVLP